MRFSNCLGEDELFQKGTQGINQPQRSGLIRSRPKEKNQFSRALVQSCLCRAAEETWNVKYEPSLAVLSLVLELPSIVSQLQLIVSQLPLIVFQVPLIVSQLLWSWGAAKAELGLGTKELQFDGTCPHVIADPGCLRGGFPPPGQF